MNNSNSTKKYGYTFSFIVLLLLILVKHSQASDLSFQNIVSNKIFPEENTSAKLQLAERIKRSDPVRFKVLISELNQQTNITIHQQGLLDFLNAYNFIYTGQYDKAEPKLKTILQSSINHDLKFKANYHLVLVSTARKKWIDGFKYVATNVELLPEIKNRKEYENGMLATIIFYNQLGQYELALSYIEKLSKQNLSAINNCSINQLHLEAKFNLKEIKLTSNSIEQAIEECVNVNFLIPAHFIRLYKAKLYLQEKMPGKALNFLLSYIAEIRATQYPMLIADMANVIAKAYWQIDDIDNTKVYATEALTVNANMTNLLQSVDTYFLLYQVAKKQQNLPLALEYFEKYAEIEKAHLEGEKSKHLAFQLAEHNAFEQESQIKLLNEQNNTLAAEQALAKIQADNRKLAIVLLSIIILVLAILGTRLWHSHKRVKELAEFDPLTGILNRGHFTQLTQSALKYCQSAEQDLSVIMFDLDHFKKINDSFGHLCGDWALKQVTKACDKIGRKNDIFARLGGEEFCLVLPSCNIDVAILRAEACRAAIEAIITEQTGCEFTITASFGVTDVKRSGYDLDKLLADSDMAAYASKHAGRNRVTLHQVPDKESEDRLASTWDYN